MMTTEKTISIKDLEARIAALEERLAKFEASRASAPITSSTAPFPPSKTQPDIPWTVIAAAVAAAVPRARIVSIVNLEAPVVNWWGMEGRRSHFRSHFVR